ncbi:alpha/beta fold hydrolase [Glycomyces lechevalierae]|uniref:Alpha/beta hydrolase n=1 Tax=Glycomyces lechevalierae TaxID=256034 RepID=A0A9X3SWX5_9ACTN|nr:alpha/beta hydrolase [Glycomyces lechevalierae]MDA1386387.1 alpha/beta hydrolase [Glycomyces lechevalierae]MDR7338903.1 pimeloyl-ACP methyl ester carboxylesterase [Glycomyces lechevalierae]
MPALSTPATLSVAAAQVAYRVVPSASGSERRLVLVHGTGSGGAEFVWGQLLDHFAATHTLVLPELSGTVHTVDDGAPLTVETLANQVIAVIEAERAEGEPVDLIGFSLGGSVVAAVAALRPDLVVRLVTMAGFSRSDHLGFQQSVRLWQSLADDPERFGRLAAVLAFSPGFLGAIDAPTLDFINAGMVPDEGTLRHIDLDLRLDIRGLLPRVTAPTLVVGNAKDALVPVELTREIAHGIAGSEYVELDSGHVTFAEQPDAALKAVDDFLS